MCSHFLFSSPSPTTRLLFSHPDLSNSAWMPLFLPQTFERWDEMGKQTGTQRRKGSKQCCVISLPETSKDLTPTAISSLLCVWSAPQHHSACSTSVPTQTCSFGSGKVISRCMSLKYEWWVTTAESKFAWVGYLWLQLHLNHPCPVEDAVFITFIYVHQPTAFSVVVTNQSSLQSKHPLFEVTLYDWAKMIKWDVND